MYDAAQHGANRRSRQAHVQKRAPGARSLGRSIGWRGDSATGQGHLQLRLAARRLDEVGLLERQGP